MIETLAWVDVLILPHELGHALAATAYGYRVRPYASWRGIGIRFDAGAGLPRRRDVIITLAGPGTNVALVPVFLLAGQPVAAAGSLLLGLGNLLPIRGSDGWRLLRAARRPA